MLITAREKNLCLLGLKERKESQTVDTLKKEHTQKNRHISTLFGYQAVDI